MVESAAACSQRNRCCAYVPGYDPRRAVEPQRESRPPSRHQIGLGPAQRRLNSAVSPRTDCALEFGKAQLDAGCWASLPINRGPERAAAAGKEAVIVAGM